MPLTTSLPRGDNGRFYAGNGKELDSIGYRFVGDKTPRATARLSFDESTFERTLAITYGNAGTEVKVRKTFDESKNLKPVTVELPLTEFHHKPDFFAGLLGKDREAHQESFGAMLVKALGGEQAAAALGVELTGGGFFGLGSPTRIRIPLMVDGSVSPSELRSGGPDTTLELPLSPALAERLKGKTINGPGISLGDSEDGVVTGVPVLRFQAPELISAE